ncbi:UNVERIFIED_CONTAM: hypothetical protein GTU68_057728 [Idotea baltica]|nr:hypothetical protein [Idotea baltica]
MQRNIIDRIKITPAEVKEFFNAIPQDSLPYFNSEVTVAQILIQPKVNEEQKEIARQKLAEIRGRVQGGESFEDLATVYSEDPGSAANGGRLGLVNRGDLVPEFEATAFALEKEEVSDIVETQFGFHIIKLIERRGNKIDAQHILIKPLITDPDLEITKTLMDSIRIAIVNDSISFEDAVAAFSEDETSQANAGIIKNQQTGSNYFEMDQLDPDIFFAIDGLKEGEISEPVVFSAPDGSQFYRVFQMIRRTAPHIANYKDDYDKIRNIAELQKQQEIMDNWIKRKSASTYVFLDDSYNTCELLEKWKKK